MKNLALYNRHEGQSVWIVGKGPSLMHLRAEHIGFGPVIALNHAIIAIEAMEIPNTTYSLQKDFGCFRPRNAELILHDRESGDAFPDYPNRYVFSLSELGFSDNVFSLAFAIKISEFMGCEKIFFVCCDLHVNGDERTYIPGQEIISHRLGYGRQRQLLPQYLDGLFYEFLTPVES